VYWLVQFAFDVIDDGIHPPGKTVGVTPCPFLVGLLDLSLPRVSPRGAGYWALATA